MTAGILSEARSFSNFSKPKETTRRIKDDTQNQTLTEKTKNFVTPAEVIDSVKNPKFVVAIVWPGVMKSVGMEMNAAKAGIQMVLERRYLKETLDATAKMIGITQISTK